ncbi:uncharacterized protein LOC143286608 [Babylonia areolata]|uniref:uncharacterized protein LOC143286608 n=1 Tax=Babylonia areolata TaxID=304850 RepID=UPI003FD035EE
MRTAALLLVLVLSASLMSETEAGWFRRAWRRVKDFVKRNVRVRVSVQRSVRDAEGGADGMLGVGVGRCTMQEILHHYGCEVGKANDHVTKETEDAIFGKSDVNKDNILNDEEQKTFELMYLAEILEACVEKKVASENDVL